MSVTDQLLENNEKYAAGFSGPLPLPPSKNIAVLACMDARLNVYGVLGLEEGESHVIRNAGGVVTDDEIRSLAISQRLLGTKEIVLIHHTDCGMLTFTDDEFKASIQEDTGLKPAWAAEAFDDLDTDVRQSIARIKASPFVPHTDQVRGFVFDVGDRAAARGRLSAPIRRLRAAPGSSGWCPSCSPASSRPWRRTCPRCRCCRSTRSTCRSARRWCPWRSARRPRHRGRPLPEDDHRPVGGALCGLGLFTSPDRSVPSALIVTVTFAGGAGAAGRRTVAVAASSSAGASARVEKAVSVRAMRMPPLDGPSRGA